MPREAFDYNDLGGGMNRGGSPSEIQQKQMAIIENFYPYSTLLRRRGGMRAISDDWDQAILGIFTYRKVGQDPLVICGGKDKFGKLIGTTITDIFAGDVSLNQLSYPWCFFQYKDYVYAMRKLSGRMIRIDSDVTRRSGIDAPTSAPTIAQGATGDLPSGTYRAVYTFYNKETGIESNPSDESNALSLASSKKIDYTGIGISANPFVNARRIYRTLENQVGVYFFVAQIDDNLTTTFTGDNVQVADLGRTVSFNNGTPPSQAKIGVVWQERCFCSDGRDIYYSEPLMVEAFGEESIIPVFPDDGHEIRGLHAFGDRLIIAKTNKIHYLVGASPASFGLHTLTDVHGCLSHHSIQSAEGNLFWYGSGKTVMRSDGTNVKEIGNPEIKPYLDAVVEDEQVVGKIYPAFNWYILALPTGYTLIYNYRFDTWTSFVVNSLFPFSCLADYYDENGLHKVYAAYAEINAYALKLLEFNDATYYADDTPLGTYIILGRAQSRMEDFGYPGKLKALNQVWLLLSTAPHAPESENISGLGLTISWGMGQFSEVSMANRDVTVDTGFAALWRCYRMSQASMPEAHNQLNVYYNGGPNYPFLPPIDIQQIHFEVLVSNRHHRLR